MTKQKHPARKITVKDLARKRVCDGHLYLTTAEGRRFYIMQPAMLIDGDFIKKHAATHAQLELEPVVRDELSMKFRELFKQLRYHQFEKDLREKSAEILAAFCEAFQQEEHFLSFATAAFEEFCHAPQELLEQLYRTDMHLFRKSFYAAAFSVVTALSNDFFHYTMLRDFYTVTLLLDVGLCDAGYSYHVSRACNEENRRPGTGAKLLQEERCSELELKTFLEHPRRGHALLEATKLLAYPEFADIVLYQHELADGSGFPRGVRKESVAGTEAVVILADALVEISDNFPFETNAVAHLLQFNNPKLRELPVEKAHRRLCLALEHFGQLRKTGS
jgi:hypothetical protein